MKKILKTSISIILLFLMFSVNMINVSYAAPTVKSKYSEKPTIGTESSSTDSGSDFYILDNNNELIQDSTSTVAAISAYGSEITKVSSGYIRGYGKTLANSIVDEIGYTLYFQMWDGYKWVSIDSITVYGTYAAIVQDYHYKTVTPGKYYRVSTDHYIIADGVTKTATSTSTYILVN